MTKEKKREALDIIMAKGGTVQMNPTVNGFVKEEYLGLIDSCHNTLKALIDAGYCLHLGDGRILIDYYK